MPSPEDPASAPDPILELLKLEYETAAARYNNIYQSVWTIFSYLGAVSGAIVAFGPDKVRWDLLVVIAAVPLLFWFWSTYLPLDAYGQDTLTRLKSIEHEFHARYGAPTHLFCGFHEYRKNNFIFRAKPRIVIFFVVLHLLFIWSARHAFYEHLNGEPMFFKQPATAASAAPGR
jgi:hypothetical protein